MKLIIFGSTGRTGKRLVEQALEQGHEVTAFARSPEKVELTHTNLRIVQGDVLDLDAVSRAIRGMDAVLCALGSGPFDKNQILSKGTKNIIHAMQESGVKRVICQSAMGVGDSRDALPFIYKYLLIPTLLRFVYADHEIQESYLKDSRLDWTIVRPGALIQGELTGAYWQGLPPAERSLISKITFADVADSMLKNLFDNSFLHQAPILSY